MCEFCENIENQDTTYMVNRYGMCLAKGKEHSDRYVVLTENKHKLIVSDEVIFCPICGRDLRKHEKINIFEESECTDQKPPTHKERKEDAVSHPSHYCDGRKYEPKDVMRDWGLNFNIGSAVKYLSRAGRKDDTVQDLEKAIQFIQFEIEFLKNKKETDRRREEIKKIIGATGEK